MLHPGMTRIRSCLIYNVDIFTWQAHGDLVSAVDFNEEFLMTGYEDANVGVWSMATGQQIHNMLGHNGGVTGIQIQFNLAASSSYDTTVSMKTLRRYQIFVLTFSHSIHLYFFHSILCSLSFTRLWVGRVTPVTLTFMVMDQEYGWVGWWPGVSAPVRSPLFGFWFGT